MQAEIQMLSRVLGLMGDWSALVIRTMVYTRVT
jgi:hypothetical protein